MNNKMANLLKRQKKSNVKLNKQLREILKEGIIEKNGCYVFKYFYLAYSSYLSKSKDRFEDLTSYENFVNGFDVDLYCDTKILEKSLLFASRLVKLLSKEKCQYFVLLSTWDSNDVHITFCTSHLQESPLMYTDNLDSCDAKILIFKA